MNHLASLVERFGGRTLLVLGDMIADEYIYGKPVRISREAPVPILRYESREVRLGGAANASHNAHTIGNRVIPVGVVGRDQTGGELRSLFQRIGIPEEGLVEGEDHITPVKTRIMAGGYQSTRHQMVRVDREPSLPISPSLEALLLDRLRFFGAQADAILLSDYGYGTVTPRLVEEVLLLGRRNGHIVTADSRYELLRFRGVTAATPNEPEVEELVGSRLDDDRDVEKAGRYLLDRLDARLVLITRGSKGMALLERDGPATFLQIYGSDQIADVTGAGDIVISTFTAALATGADPVDAAWLANLAGGVKVMKSGTAPVTKDELLQAIAHGNSPHG